MLEQSLHHYSGRSKSAENIINLGCSRSHFPLGGCGGKSTDGTATKNWSLTESQWIPSALMLADGSVGRCKSTISRRCVRIESRRAVELLLHLQSVIPALFSKSQSSFWRKQASVCTCIHIEWCEYHSWGLRVWFLMVEGELMEYLDGNVRWAGNAKCKTFHSPFREVAFRFPRKEPMKVSFRVAQNNLSEHLRHIWRKCNLVLPKSL